MDYKYELKHFGSRWGIEVDTEELGKVMLLQPNSKLPIAITFDTRKEAFEYLEEYKLKHSKGEN